MNSQADKYFAMTGKQKVNGLIWKAVTQDKKYKFISMLMLMGVTSKWYTVYGRKAEEVKQ